MQVKEVMTSNVQTVKPDATARDAAIVMKECNIGALPVVENDEVVGMITDRDIIVRVTSNDLFPAHVSIAEMMSRDIKTCTPEMKVEQAVLIMEEHCVRRLIVKHEDGRPAGIITVGDIARKSDTLLTGAMMRKVAEGEAQKCAA
ncbi:MAG: CBS domain-containing protein [Chitinivibrionales bacterium]|nr:CBS domain-containing protein [Chitinivibrionales bacterium]